MVFFRMNRLDEALDDVNAALDIAPSLPSSLFLRGVILEKQGKNADGAVDLAGARLISPQIGAKYARYGIKP